ncbi:MAG TPA: hypothetical protein VND23_07820, partial [Acidimicrobiales bacterium]|nr:hypothetical protein [Acidimicrobiales bacterium]
MSHPGRRARAGSPRDARRPTGNDRRSGTAGALGGAVATLVFVDDGPWISFNQLAARARRSGCRVVRVTTDASLASRIPGLLLYDRSVVVRPGAPLPALDELAGAG